MRIWNHYPDLTEAVRKSHVGLGNLYGHTFDHALRVAHVATLITPDHMYAHLAGAAALCHNADRILQKKYDLGPYGKINEEEVIILLEDWLNSEPNISRSKYAIIVDAVLKHSEKNRNDDSPALIALKDADRIVNIEADLIMREGQMMPELQVVNPYTLLHDPDATYIEPGSVLRHIKELLDWDHENGPVGIRLPKARELAKSRFDFLKVYLEKVIEQRLEYGLIPYPPFGKIF